MESAKIILLSILSAIAYGICHDQITARVCVEYFTIGHPPVFNTTSPTLLAFGWGVIATWWVGLILGCWLAFAARSGSRPKLGARELVPWISVLLAVMGVCSLVSGIVGYILATRGLVGLDAASRARLPQSAHDPFIADLWAHSAAYGVGFVGGAVLCFVTWRGRSRRGKTDSSAEETPAHRRLG